MCCFNMVAHVLLTGLIDSVFSKLHVEISENVDFITNELEAVVNGGQDALLHHKLFDVAYRASQFLNRFVEPHLGFISSCFAHSGHKNFDPVVKFFGCGLQLGLDRLRIKL